MDNVNHPSHYNQNNIETIDIIETMLSEEMFAGFLFGNVIKYLDRYKFKNGVEDLEKAQWYLRRYTKLHDDDIESNIPFVKALHSGEFEGIDELWNEEREKAELVHSVNVMKNVPCENI